MKTLWKTFRSIITSFLCVILVFNITLQFILSVIYFESKSVTDLMDSSYVLNKLEIEDNDLTNNYVKEYISYIFYKRSYPSNDNELFNKINDKLELEYDDILKVRKINDCVTNTSFYLLINISILVIFIIISLVNNNFLIGIFSMGMSFLMSSFIIFAFMNFIYPIMDLDVNFLTIAFQSIIDNLYVGSYLKYNIVYFIFGIILSLSSFLTNKRSAK